MYQFKVIVLALALASTAALAQKGGNSKFAADAMNVVADLFNDPDSVKFRNVGIYQKEEGEERYVCGQVNAKNLYGAYVGYKWFYATQTKAQIVTNQDGRLDSFHYQENCYKKLFSVK